MINKVLLFILLTLTVIISTSSVAKESAAKEIIAEKIYLEHTWLKLLHFNDENGIWSSSADHTDFFITTNGQSNPRKELIESHKRLVDEKQSNNFQCKYPARTFWIVKRFKLQLPKPDCPLLYSWLKQFSLDRLFIVFATADMNSPPSMFGHTFLRIPSSNYKSELLSSSFNYSADEGNDTKGLGFIFKGMTGGYSNKIDTIPFHRRKKTYSEIEGRDLWEYELNLSSSEIKFIVLHIWEIKNHAFEYYFFDENCSYQTLAMINVAKPNLNMTKSFSHYAIPIDTLRALKSNNLITKSTYRASSTSLFSSSRKKLSPSNNMLVYKIASGVLAPNESELKSQPTHIQDHILSLSFDFTSLLISRGKIPSAEGDAIIKSIIQSKLNLSKNHSASEKESVKKNDPLKGHKSKRIVLTTGKENQQNYWQLGFRPAYHDFLDPIDGFDIGNSISLFNVEYRVQNMNNNLQNLEIIKIESRPNNDLFFNRHSWSFDIKRTKKHIEQEKRLTNSISYLRGHSYQLNEYNFSYLLGASLDYNSVFKDSLGLESQARFELRKDTSNLSYLLSYGLSRYIVGANSHRKTLNLAASFSHNNSYRFVLNAGNRNYSDKEENYFELAYRYYF